MNRPRIFTGRRALGAALLVVGCLLAGGCQQTAGLNGEPVITLPSHNVIALGPDDIACIMIRAGFTDRETLDLGPAIRNALAVAGGARVCVDGVTEAMFATVGRYVHVASRRRGSFIYDADNHCLR